MRPRRLKQYCLQLDIALWCKNQIEHSIWDDSLLLSNCACLLDFSSLSTLAGLSYHICGKLEVAFKASPSSQHQHCTDETQKAEEVLRLRRSVFWVHPIQNSTSLWLHFCWVSSRSSLVFLADRLRHAWSLQLILLQLILIRLVMFLVLVHHRIALFLMLISGTGMR